MNEMAPTSPPVVAYSGLAPPPASHQSAVGGVWTFPGVQSARPVRHVTRSVQCWYTVWTGRRAGPAADSVSAATAAQPSVDMARYLPISLPTAAPAGSAQRSQDSSQPPPPSTVTCGTTLGCPKNAKLVIDMLAHGAPGSLTCESNFCT